MPQQPSQTTDETNNENYLHFRDSLSTLLHHLSQPTTTRNAITSKRRSKAKAGRKTAIKPVETLPLTSEGAADDAEDLADFVEYLAHDIFWALPEDLRTLEYATVRRDEVLAVKYEVPLSTLVLEDIAASFLPSTTDSLLAYNLITPSATEHVTSALVSDFLPTLLHAYITPLIAPPSSLPTPTTLRATSCEICDRDWIPLTYHHLIPRSVHAKVVKRGWHEEWQLNSVAWLCRACHSFVHGLASNEELAREWYTVDLLMEREDVMRWVGWVAKVRWKSR